MNKNTPSYTVVGNKIQIDGHHSFVLFKNKSTARPKKRHAFVPKVIMTTNDTSPEWELLSPYFSVPFLNTKTFLDLEAEEGIFSFAAACMGCFVTAIEKRPRYYNLIHDVAEKIELKIELIKEPIETYKRSSNVVKALFFAKRPELHEAEALLKVGEYFSDITKEMLFITWPSTKDETEFLQIMEHYFSRTEHLGNRKSEKIFLFFK